MNPLDFMQTALRLSAGSEANKRSAVSRAYYSAYHVAREFVTACGVRFPSTAATHEALPWCLSKSGDVVLVTAARELRSLRTSRNEADYDLHRPGFADQTFINRRLQIAQAILTALAASNRAQAEPAIRQYASSVLKLSLTPDGS
jgi:uncharacterized protein (UPF0332 family)